MVTLALYFVLAVAVVFFFLLNRQLKKYSDLQAEFFKLKKEYANLLCGRGSNCGQ